MEKRLLAGRQIRTVARELQRGGEIVLRGVFPPRLPVFTKCVVIHALGLHVWVKVFFFFHCSQHGETKISDLLKKKKKEGCK